MADFGEREQLPSWWGEDAQHLFTDGLVDRADAFGLGSDAYAQDLFYAGYVDPNLNGASREAARDALDAYLYSEYDIDFDDVFDWNEFREWYDSQ